MLFRTIVFSLGIHAVLATILVFGNFKTNFKTRSRPFKDLTKPIDITLEEPVKEKETSIKKQKKSPKLKSRKLVTKIKSKFKTKTTKTKSKSKINSRFKKANTDKVISKDIKSFFPQETFLTTADGESKLKLQKQESHEEGVAKLEVAIREAVSLKEIWIQINNRFYYPSVFRLNKIYGSAEFDVDINNEGKLISILPIGVGNHHLKWFIYKVLEERRDLKLRSKISEDPNLVISKILAFKIERTRFPEAGKVVVAPLNYLDRLDFNIKVFEPVLDELPISPAGVDLIKLGSMISGQDKKIDKIQKQKLEAFTERNKSFILNKIKHF